jgi:phenylacetic acid degradation protein PaaD
MPVSGAGYRGRVTADPAQELAEACAAAMLATDAASAWLGMRLVSVGPGRASVAMRISRQMLNGHRTGHGGLIFSLADTAFAVACNSYNRSTVAAGCDIDFVQAVHEGDELTAVAVERYRRGRNGLYDVTVRRADAEVVAELRGRAREVSGSLL